MFETEEVKEKLILVSVSLGNPGDTEKSLDELEELVDTAGGECVGRMVQNLDSFVSATYLGKGKIEELKMLIDLKKADGIVCDDELSPMQLKNLTDELNVKVMDRTLIILDIFAARATTREGKIQVELAQLRYRSTRLLGFGKDLSRLGGGIGTRGPGEKKLEIDRRVIKNRIAQLRQDVKEIEKHRELTRKNRKAGSITNVAIVGYTNAGKSTFLNTVTNASILEEDKLFATLDPTTREYTTKNGGKILFTDTVGFIRKLPHHLVEAFKSTLEEAMHGDIILHIIDVSNEQYEEQMKVVYETLDSLGVKNKPVISVFNKIDKLSEEEKNDIIFKDVRAKYVECASIKKGIGIDNIINDIEEIIREQKIYVEKLIPYSEAGIIQKIRKDGELLKEEYKEDGIYVEAYIPPFMRL